MMENWSRARQFLFFITLLALIAGLSRLIQKLIFGWRSEIIGILFYTDVLMVIVVTILLILAWKGILK